MAHTDIEQLLDQVLAGEPSDEQPSHRPEILVVDDDAGVCEALTLALGETYSVLSATTGDDGVGLLHPGTMVVVLDVRMRVKDGFDTFVEMKKKQSEVPIIFHSAYQDVRDPYEIINELRPFGYIKKGDEEALRQAIAQAVDQSRERLEKQDLALLLEEENARLEALEAERNQELEALAQEAASGGSTEPEQNLPKEDD